MIAWPESGATYVATTTYEYTACWKLKIDLQTTLVSGVKADDNETRPIQPEIEIYIHMPILTEAKGEEEEEEGRIERRYSNI